MGKTETAVFVSLTLGLLSDLGGLAQEPAAESKDQRLSISKQMLYTEIWVYLRDGPPIFGLLAGIEPGSLIVRKDGQDIPVPPERLQKVILKTDSNLNRNMLYGMVAGLYAGSIVLFHESYQPFAFAEKLKDSEYQFEFIYEPLFVACGIGLGYLAILVESGEKVFDFGSSQEAQIAAWEKLRGFIAGVPQPAKIHSSIYGGTVYPGVSSHYDRILGDAGYRSYAGASRFNLLRRAQVTYSLAPPLEFGVAYLSASEPSAYYSFYGGDSDTAVWMSFDPGYFQKGMYLVGAFRPRWSQKASGAVGFGVGAARARIAFSGFRNVTEYVLDVTRGYSIWLTVEEKQLSYKNKKTFFSGFAYAELSIRLYEHLHVGISGDYVLKHTVEIPAFEDFGLPARKVRLGNGSIGIAIGWHF
jgi:hypothetical protein